ncbi:hypothetical protein [Luteibacter aegosomatissinici]|uniref:hypothetical protein n=1 Tax=Luteibacter aegosomatissinici TaxID=2911539 RepID=UPI001FFBA6A1|nr:hypothetical protein [Luteibacter aegosomatissinici]UPG92680.1 hypothetical protein L2Y97_12470 [Luteibacter aegosomatissinici]
MPLFPRTVLVLTLLLALPLDGALAAPPPAVFAGVSASAIRGPGIAHTAASRVVLPIEVLGDGNPQSPLVRDAGFSLPAVDAAAATSLWFVCHPCGFFGAPEFEATAHTPVKVKASVLALGGALPSDTTIPWTDITDATLTG